MTAAEERRFFPRSILAFRRSVSRIRVFWRVIAEIIQNFMNSRIGNRKCATWKRASPKDKIFVEIVETGGIIL